MNGSRALLIHLSVLLTVVAGFCEVGEAQPTATVRVHVTDRAGETANAWVTLTPQEGGAAHDCRTQNGACEIEGVGPGRYIVTATPRDGGRPPLPRVVPVPARVPSIELRVRLL